MSLVSPRALTLLAADGLANFAGTKLEWTRKALHKKESVFSPLHTFMKIAENTCELTPGSERLTAHAMRALLAPMQMPSLMEVEDAKDTLQLVGKKVVARAAKRKAEALEASALRNAKLVELGQRRAAKRAAIAARPVKTHRSVDNVGRANGV